MNLAQAARREEPEWAWGEGVKSSLVTEQTQDLTNFSACQLGPYKDQRALYVFLNH